ncbi:hypothetical protein OIU84_007184 [Salix udensis]|uniref:Uncharacterized protein n=1 Tax=Salix udensis TaxID=889485 RepID=A0AAD6JSI2_9ROSI|nr:hypothetical protein OIU84_007184 [Salix udensis]
MVHVGFISQSRKPVKKQFDACRFHMLAALILELEPMADRAHDIPRMVRFWSELKSLCLTRITSDTIVLNKEASPCYELTQ